MRPTPWAAGAHAAKNSGLVNAVPPLRAQTLNLAQGVELTCSLSNDILKQLQQ